MQYCEAQSLITLWGYECIEIPYLYSIDKKIHRYYPDFYLEFKDGRKFIIEIKPENQAIGKGSIYNKLSFIKNRDKWKACKSFCEAKGFEFKVVTEKDLF